MPDSRDAYTAEQRIRLDGGLNTRASPLQVAPSQAVSVSNFRTEKDGAIQVRDGASLAFTLDYPGDTSANAIPAPGVEAVAGGSIAQPLNFKVKVVYQGWEGNIGPSLESAQVSTGAGTQTIRVKVKPNNLGEGVGQDSSVEAYLDDPLMSGVSNSTILVYVKEVGTNTELPIADTYYKQTEAAFAWDNTEEAWILDYATLVSNLGGIISATKNPQPFRKLYYYETAEMCLAIQADRGFQFPTFSAWSGANEWLIPSDKDGNLYYLSRVAGALLSLAESQRVIVLTDGMRPKKAVFGGGSSPYVTPNVNNAWTMLGANPPDAAAVVTNIAGTAVAINTVYTYRMTFIYRHGRVINRNQTEYWYSESRPTQSNTRTVSIFNPSDLYIQWGGGVGLGVAETNLYKIRLYRTLDHSATPTSPGRFYRVVDLAPATTNYTDSTTDASLVGRKTDPDDEGKIPLDVPPNTLLHAIGHRGRIYAIIGKATTVSITDLRVRTIVGTNIGRVSLVQKGTGFYSDPNGTDTDTIEQSIDAWPDDDDHSVILGSSGGVSALVSYRGRVIVFKPSEIGVWLGDNPGEYDYATLYTDIGAIPNSVVVVQGVIFFWNAEKGPYVFEGSSYRWVGDNIQPTWKTYIDQAYYCSDVIHDREKNEVRWSFTNASVDPDTAAGDEDTARGSFVEFAFSLTSNSWWMFSGAGRAREVKAAANVLSESLVNPNVGSLSVIFGDTGGNILEDHAGNDDNGTAITASVEFKLFGFDPQDFSWVKVFKVFQMMYTLGNVGSGTVIVQAKTSEGANYTTMLTLNTATVGEEVTVQEFNKPINATDNISQDRGVWIKITSTVDVQFVINAIMVEYERVTNYRKAIK